MVSTRQRQLLSRWVAANKSSAQKTIKLSFSTFSFRNLSSWGSTSLPWSLYRESPWELERAKKEKAVRHKWIKLEAAVHSAVREYLTRTFPKEFAIRSRGELWATAPSPSSSSSKTSKSSSSRSAPQLKQQLSKEGKTLLSLNGFQLVPLPKSMDLLDLAEGVVVKPVPPKELKKYLLFSQQIADEDTEHVDSSARTKSTKKDESQKKKEYPEFVQEDLTLYRVLENQAAVFLDNRYNAFQRFVERRIDAPFKRLADRVATNYLMSGFPKETEMSETNKHHNNKSPDQEDADDIDSIKHLNPPSKPATNGPEPLENVLSMSYENDEVTLYQHFSPSTRICAVPYDLIHSSASTLVHVSLVIFGALPLAYRSYNFAVDYPGWSQAIAASVVFTITYGVWQYRVSTRTNQSLVITNALLHRFYARDDAVISVLQEGAVCQVSRAILAIYCQKWLDSGDDDSKLFDKQLVPKALPFILSETSLVDPVLLAINFGLIKADEENSGKRPPTDGKWKAVSLVEALSYLEPSSTRHM